MMAVRMVCFAVSILLGRGESLESLAARKEAAERSGARDDRAKGGADSAERASHDDQSNSLVLKTRNIP